MKMLTFVRATYAEQMLQNPERRTLCVNALCQSSEQNDHHIQQKESILVVRRKPPPSHDADEAAADASQFPFNSLQAKGRNRCDDGPTASASSYLLVPVLPQDFNQESYVCQSSPSCQRTGYRHSDSSNIRSRKIIHHHD